MTVGYWRAAGCRASCGRVTAETVRELTGGEGLPSSRGASLCASYTYLCTSCNARVRTAGTCHPDNAQWSFSRGQQMSHHTAEEPFTRDPLDRCGHPYHESLANRTMGSLDLVYSRSPYPTACTGGVVLRLSPLIGAASVALRRSPGLSACSPARCTSLPKRVPLLHVSIRTIFQTGVIAAPAFLSPYNMCLV